MDHKKRKATSPTWSRMISPLGLQIYFWPRATVTFDPVHLSCHATDICHTVCLPVLVKISCIVLDKYWWKGFQWPILVPCGLDLWLPDPKVAHFMPCPVDHVCQFALKSVHFLSKYHVHKFGNWRMHGWRDNPRTMPLHLPLWLGGGCTKN